MKERELILFCAFYLVFFLAGREQISPETTKIFIEVTSSTSMKDCTGTMDALLLAMVQGGFGVSTATSINTLDLRQVKIEDYEGKLRRVFPAKGDLVFDENELIAVELQQ